MASGSSGCSRGSPTSGLGPESGSLEQDSAHSRSRRTRTSSAALCASTTPSGRCPTTAIKSNRQFTALRSVAGPSLTSRAPSTPGPTPSAESSRRRARATSKTDVELLTRDKKHNDFHLQHLISLPPPSTPFPNDNRSFTAFSFLSATVQGQQ